jgi:hypothetical protein
MNENDLTSAGYTDSGRKRYLQTVESYTTTLHEKALKFAEADKAADASVEVTHDHVRQAAHNIAGSFGADKPSRMSIPCQVGEYLCTAAAGVGGGSLSSGWGTPTLVISIAVGVILFVYRQTSLKH